MNNAILLLSILLLTTPIAAQPSQAKVVAFVNVNVVPMDRERVLRNQTVIVRDGTIAAMGDSKRNKPPAGAQVIEDRKSTRLNSSHSQISYAVFCLKKKKIHALIVLL